MMIKNSGNLDLLKNLKILGNDSTTAPYFLATKESFEAADMSPAFTNYFYTIGLYYGDGASIRIGQTIYELRRGSLLTIGPGMACQWLNSTFPQNDTLFFYDDIFVKSFNNSLLYSLEYFCPDEHSVLRLHDDEFEEMQQLFSTLRMLKNRPDALTGILFSILMVAQKHFWKEHRGNKKQLSDKERIVVEFRSLVAKNFTDYKDVKYYAGRLNMTPKYLSELLVHHTGYSAKAWIEFHLMQEAKYLLSFMDLSVKQVAYHLGYTDTSHFSRAFFKYEGQQPSGYKNGVRLSNLPSKKLQPTQ